MDKNTKMLFEILFREIYGSIPAEIEAMLKNDRFSPPSVDEVTEYLREKNVQRPEENAQKFYNFYEAKGWMIGKNKMKNWKSAVSTWDFPKKGLVI